MCTFAVAIPFDLLDPKYGKDGKSVKSALEKWDDKVSFWEETAKEDTIGFDIPTQIVVDSLNLQDKKEIGEYYDKERCIRFNPEIKQVSNADALGAVAILLVPSGAGAS